MSTPKSDKVAAKLVYTSPPSGALAYHHLNANPLTGVREFNYIREEKEVEIDNIRGKEDSVTLDTAGFQFYQSPSKHTSFANDEIIKEEYYPESIELIKKLTGASRVELFHHKIRRRQPGQLDDSDQPVGRAHIDVSSKLAVDIVYRHLPPNDVPELLKHRFQIINLWRPISHPAEDWPLALCDYRSIDPVKDTFPIAVVLPDTKEAESLGVYYSEKHEWKYLRNMTPDELVLFKSFDSVQDGSVSVFAPHTAFQDPTTSQNAPFRESIELRALVFYDD